MVTWNRRFLHRRRASGLGDWAIMVHSLHRLTHRFVRFPALPCLPDADPGEFPKM